MSQKKRVLFLCVANSARSQMAEALLRHTDSEHFEVCSAGSAPTEVDIRARDALEHLGVSTDGLYSKSIEQVAGEPFDYVITLCDKSALECLAMPGAGEYIAWNFEDPVTSSQKDAYRKTLHEIHERIKMFVLIKNRPTKEPSGSQAMSPTEVFKCLADETR
ncbi:ArsR family transcriptional regulator, partial [Pseudomonas gessardii]